MADEVVHAEEDVQVVRELIALMKQHADELRAKDVPVDDMIRDLEQQLDKLVAAIENVGELHAEDEFLTKKRDHLRRDVEGMTAGLPSDLVDGMATIAYLHGAAKREVERKRRGKKGIGG